MNRTPAITRSRISGSTYRSRTNHELVARVQALKRTLFDLGIEPEDCAVARQHAASLMPMAQEKRPSFWDMFRRKM